MFYIIFTSGSTGRPKGVQITEKNLYSFVSWSADLFGGPGVFMNQAPVFLRSVSHGHIHSADFRRNGGEVWARPAPSGYEPRIRVHKGQRRRVLRVNAVLRRTFCWRTGSFHQKASRRSAGSCSAGRNLRKETAAKLFERFPDAKVINTYGPTEATVAVSSTEVTSQMMEDDRTIPVGRPKPGTDIYVDNDELIIAGDSVSPGYYMDEVKNSEGGFRLHPTADDATGQATAVSMMTECFTSVAGWDSQIKMNGYRIELEDIENNLLKLDGVGERPR